MTHPAPVRGLGHGFPCSIQRFFALDQRRFEGAAVDDRIMSPNPLMESFSVKPAGCCFPELQQVLFWKASAMHTWGMLTSAPRKEVGPPLARLMHGARVKIIDPFNFLLYQNVLSPATTFIFAFPIHYFFYFFIEVIGLFFNPL